FSCIFAIAVSVARAPAIVDLHVAANGPAQLLQPLQERRIAGLVFRVARGEVREYSDTPHPLGLLCARRERPSGHRTADKRDELASLHVPSARDHALCNGYSLALYD